MHRSWIRRLIVPLLMTLSLLLLGWSTLTVQASAGLIHGQVLAPNGAAPPVGTVVRVSSPDGAQVVGAGQVAADGAFSIPLPNGRFLLRAVPPQPGPLTPSMPRFVSVIGGPVNVGILRLTTPQIEGTVYAPDGQTPAGAVLSLFDGGGHPLQEIPAPDGRFVAGGLPAGEYWLRAHPAEDAPYWHSPRQQITILPAAPVQGVTLTLTAADLWGVTRDEAGHPVAGATVGVMRDDGHHASDTSSASGFWAIGGLEPGDYVLAARPPWERSTLQPPEPLPITIPTTDNPYTLTFGFPQKLLVGHVVTQNEEPVAHAAVIANRQGERGQARTLSGEDGSYTLQLGPGIWSVTVQPTDSSDPAHWIYPHAPQIVHFPAEPGSEVQRQDFRVLVADSAISGTVTLPDGGVPGFTVTVAVENSEGQGRRTVIAPEDGSFILRVPHGGYKIHVHPDDPGFLGPALEPVRVPPTTTVSLGEISLLARDGLISGTLRAGDDRLLPGVPVVAWRPGVPGSLHAESGQDGVYALAVTSGTWHVQPAPRPDQPFIYTGGGARVQVESGQVVPDVDFLLRRATATIQGVLVDPASDPVPHVDGFASATRLGDPRYQTGAPIRNGMFVIHVPPGEYEIEADLPPNSPYLSGAPRRVTVAAGETVRVALPVLMKDAAIAGTLVNPRAGNEIVTGVGGRVEAWSGPNVAAAPIRPDNGTYHLEVAAGVWHLNYRLQPDSGWVRVGGPLNVAVESGATVLLPLPVIPRDAVLRGVVLAPDGSPVAGAVVRAKGTVGEVQGLVLESRSRQDGRFELPVPYGRYRLGAALPGDHPLVQPVEQVVALRPDQLSDGHVLQFRRPDARLSGTLTVHNSPAGGRVHVWAFSEDGGFTEGHFPVLSSGSEAIGVYALEVVSGTTWNVGARFENESAFWMGRAATFVGSPAVDLPLELDGPHLLPPPVVVTFDASESQRIALGDQSSILIPAGAMPVEGRVTLRVVPLATVPAQHRSHVLEYGYAFFASDATGRPIEEHFNQEVLIRFSYDERDLPPGHRERSIRPAYFSTTTSEWSRPVSYSLNPAANEVMMAIDHFTDFALLSEPAASGLIFVPLAIQ